MKHKFDFELYQQRTDIEAKQKWMASVDTIPYIKFPADWEVAIIPPFGDAVVRFRVRLPNGVTKSIYLDERGSLGCFPDGAPYWEVYPYYGDIGRCAKVDTETLLRMIADCTE